MKKTYSKPPKTFDEQLTQLEERGLSIPFKNKAKKILSTISYYRFSAYLYPLLGDISNHTYKKDASFEDAYDLYKLDSELRQIVLYGIDHIEIGVRTQVIYHVSHELNTGMWMSDFSQFKNYELHLISVKKLSDRMKTSQEEFIKHYQKTYSDYIPPTWICFELLTFRSLSGIYKNIKNQDLKNKVSRLFDVKYDVLESWLEALVVVRNICAHHSRLYNRTLPKKPKWVKLKGKWVNTWMRHSDEETNKRLKIYAVLCLMKHLLDKINPKNTFKSRILNLLEKYNHLSPEHPMGMPDDWKSQPLWQ